MFYEIKIHINESQKASIKRWLKAMRRGDPTFSNAPMARFGKHYVKMDVSTAMGVMPWTDNLSGDIDAHRFKKLVIVALIEAQMKITDKWMLTGMNKAIAIIQDTPIGDYAYMPNKEFKPLVSSYV